MSIEVTQTELPGVLLIKPQVFEDERGFFFESFNKRDWIDATGVDCDFVQDNHSRSTKGVLRGLHYQGPPAAQGKLVRVLVGEVFDVAVDIRRNSPSFGKWAGHRLSSDNKLQMWIPEGFAHGFLVMTEFAEILYKTTSSYAPQLARAIQWDDEDLNIHWPLESAPIVSETDATAQTFASVESPFFE